jgi:hypothetical protein
MILFEIRACDASDNRTVKATISRQLLEEPDDRPDRMMGMEHRMTWRVLVVLGLAFAACSTDPTEVTTASNDTGSAAADSDVTEADGPVADNSAPQEVERTNEPNLAFCASSAPADEVSTSNLDGVSLDFEQQSYMAGDNAAYTWTIGTIDFTTSFYFTVECWDGDRWLSAWRAFVFGEPGYQPMSIPLGDVPAIGYGPTPGTVAIPPDAPASTYRLVVLAPARDEETGERFDQMKATGGFTVHDAPNSNITDQPPTTTPFMGEIFCPGAMEESVSELDLTAENGYRAPEEAVAAYLSDNNPYFVVYGWSELTPGTTWVRNAESSLVPLENSAGDVRAILTAVTRFGRWDIGGFTTCLPR